MRHVGKTTEKSGNGEGRGDEQEERWELIGLHCNIVKEATESITGGKAYPHRRVNQWSQTAEEQT